jgi:putative salt-induced outer membrane protein
MIRSAYLVPALAAATIAGSASAQTASTPTAAPAKASDDIPILWLAPPPDAEPATLPEPPIVTLILPPPPSPDAVALPPSARALLEQAMGTSADNFAAVEKLARQTYPQGGAQIDALAAENKAKLAEKAAAAARAKADALAAASFLDNWKGEIDLGGSYTKGNGDALSLYGAIKLTRDGLKWRQSFTARADYAKSAGVLSTDKDTAAWQPQYKVSDRFYLYGLGQFDRDEILGFSYRFTEGAGVGYTVLPGSTLHLDLETGPALRETRYVEDGRQTHVAGRASVNFLWKPNANIQITEVAAAYVETDNSNITSTTALDTKLFGPVKARLSYNLTYEKDTPTVAKSFDTITTASLVYSF